MEPWTGAQRAFAVNAFIEKRWQFCDRSAWIPKRVRVSSQSCCSISPCHQDLGSKLRGYWFCTKEERWLCKNSTYTQEHCGSERGHWKYPRRSARRYSVSLGLPEASVRRIRIFLRCTNPWTLNNLQNLTVNNLQSSYFEVNYSSRLINFQMYFKNHSYTTYPYNTRYDRLPLSAD